MKLKRAWITAVAIVVFILASIAYLQRGISSVSLEVSAGQALDTIYILVRNPNPVEISITSVELSAAEQRIVLAFSRPIVVRRFSSSLIAINLLEGVVSVEGQREGFYHQGPPLPKLRQALIGEGRILASLMSGIPRMSVSVGRAASFKFNFAEAFTSDKESPLAIAFMVEGKRYSKEGSLEVFKTLVSGKELTLAEGRIGISAEVRGREITSVPLYTVSEALEFKELWFVFEAREGEYEVEGSLSVFIVRLPILTVKVNLGSGESVILRQPIDLTLYLLLKGG